MSNPSGFTNVSSYGQMVDVTQEGEVKKLPIGSPYAEMGGTGLNRSAGVIDEEFLPALKGGKAVKVFTEMAANDPMIGALLFTIEKLLRGVTWRVESADNTPEQDEAVQFLEECMDDMSHPFDDLISEILSMLPYGWSWHEVVYKKRVGPWEKDPKKRSKYTDGKIGWRKMPIRAQETLFRWIFDETGGIKGMVQIPPPNYQQITLSIEKSLLFRTGTHKGNPEGRSILRNAYRPWYFKKRLEEFEAIGVERDLAGMPFAKIPARLMAPNATPAEKQIFQSFKKLVSNVRRDEHEGVVIPNEYDPESKNPLYEFELLSSGGSRTFDTNALIGRYEENILMTVLADFIKVGHQESGSYALHVDKTGIFRAALNAIAEAIADVFNRHAIPKLFELNGMKLDILPTIVPSNVDPPNLTELGQFMTAMSGLGMTFFPDPDLEKFLRETSHLPALPEDQEEMHRQMAQQQNAMDFMGTQTMAEGVKQKAGMVTQGMTPEQADMTSQAPTQDLQQQELDHQNALGGQQNQVAQQKMQIDAASQQQALANTKASSEHQLKHQKLTDAHTLKHAKAKGDLELKQGKVSLMMQEKKAKLELAQIQAKLKTQQQGSKADLANKQKGSAIDLDAKRKAFAQKQNQAKKATKSVKKSDNPFRRQ